MARLLELIGVGVLLGAVIVVAAFFLFPKPVQQTYGSTTSGQYGNATSSTASGTTLSTVVLVGATGRTFYVTDIDASTDLANTPLRVKDGSNIIWQVVPGTTTPYSHSFVTPLRSSAGNSITITLPGTASTTVNVSGYFVP